MKDKANELLKKLNQDNIDKYNYTDEALELIQKYENENDTDFGMVDDYTIDEIVKKDVDEYGWDRVACFLAEAEINAPYGHRIDAYGNLKNIEFEDIKYWLEEIASN